METENSVKNIFSSSFSFRILDEMGFHWTVIVEIGMEIEIFTHKSSVAWTTATYMS